MTDTAFPDRLTQLRAKWEGDPTSRVFLQLAEEYRHLGRVKEALTVLERGLKEHPGYLSALVAKGRCHLELGEGEAARAVLERVVKQDATQMVANKLLVRAYLETSEPAKARERLDLYSLLNDSDPEIEELRRRIKALDRPAPAEEPRPMDADPFSLEPPAPRREMKADVFDIDLAPPPAARRGGDEIFPLDEIAPPPPPVAAPVPAVAVAAAEPEAEEEPGDLLFPGLSSRASRQRYLEGLAAEGLFAFAAVEVIAPEPLVEAADESAWLEETAVTTSYAPGPIEPEEAPFFSAPAVPAEEDLWTEEPELEPAPLEEIEEVPVAAAGEPAATATLGELYLRQGHLAEAERMFQEVLQREPGNTAAQAGLARLAELPRPEAAEATALPRAARPLDAEQLLAGFEPASGRTGGDGVTARKIFLLNSYLKRLRQGSAQDVS